MGGIFGNMFDFNRDGKCYCRRFITESYRTCLSVNYRL